MITLVIKTKSENYFIQRRHKNCSVIYLSQSYYKTGPGYDIKLHPPAAL